MDSASLIRYLDNPKRLEEERNLLGKDALVIIDEVQKAPMLLDEVHRLIEQHGWRFGLCGSSARKLKRGKANLLGGRALRFEMFGLTLSEVTSRQTPPEESAQAFDLNKFINRGNIPNHYQEDDYWPLLESYVSDYLKEEILEESLVRNLPAFSSFLRAAAICDTELVDYTNIASDCGVKSGTVKNYYEIMCDTLQGWFLPAYTRQAKRRVKHSPKFYFANVGVVNFLAKRKGLEQGSTLFGKAFENIIINEINAWNHYQKHSFELAYWKLESGAEVDLVIEELGVAIEVKSSANITAKHLKGLKELGQEHPKFKKKMVVSLETRSRITEDGILVYSLADFLQVLWDRKLN